MISKQDLETVNKGICDRNEAIHEVAEDYKYDCHGHTLFPNNKLYFPCNKKDETSNIVDIFYNESEYKRVEFPENGDIAVFLGKDGNISHSTTMTSSENNTYTTKDNGAPLRKNVHIDDIEKMWVKLAGYYRKQPDRAFALPNLPIDSNKENSNPIGHVKENGEF
jgi:hypothetical protein